MIRKDCRIGMLVLATKKSFEERKSMNDFLSIFPLGVAKILYVAGRGWVSIGGMGAHSSYIFLPEDLILLDKVE